MIELRGITWDHPRGWGGVRAAAEAYRELRPDVRVTWETRSLQAFADQPVEELSGREDLIVLDHPSIGEAIAAGAIRRLDGLVDDAFLEEQRRSSVGRSYESYTWDGGQWALPIDAAAQVAAYRADLLESAGAAVPRTWEEVSELAASGVGVAIAAIPVDVICGFLGICRSLGAEPFAPGDGVVPSEVGAEALRILRDAVAGSHPATATWNPPAVLQRLAKGDLVYTPLAFGYVNYARPGFAGAPVRFAPSPSAGNGPSGTLGGAGLAVSTSSAHAEEACAYAAFVASPAVQRGVYVDGGGQPGHRGAWTDRAVDHAAGGFFADLLPALDVAYLRPRFDGFLGFQDDAGDLVHAFVRGDVDDADRVLADVDRRYRERRPARSGVA
ncbi:MAG TPA: extracellular solute-binding protein [Actinomycetota bacterium]|nr:extracellular solute-binding protein [Actinomycetota bacterium]